MTIYRLALALLLAGAASAHAQTPIPPAPVYGIEYGPPITDAQAAKVMDAATALARRNGWRVVITVLDPAGHTKVVQRLDNAQFGSLEVSAGKAYTVVAYKRSSRWYAQQVAAGGMGYMRVPGALPLAGGVAIIVDDKIIGSIGVSGASSDQDEQVALEGANALRAP